MAELSRGQAKFINRRPFDSLVAAHVAVAPGALDSAFAASLSVPREEDETPIKYEPR